MGGFIASTEDGVTTTLGRGGSDYTASIVGAGIGAEEIQIWTDVDGMLTADPTILPGGLSRKVVLLRGSGGAGVFRREGAASGDGAAGHREEHSGADSEFAPAAGGRNADCLPIRRASTSPIRSIACKTQHHAGEHCFDAHADGARLSAAHFRSVRPLRDAGGHAGDLRGQRVADHRQHAFAGRDPRRKSRSSPT